MVKIMGKIEVEKKFIPDETHIGRIAENFTFVDERKFTDMYFDTADYSLTRKDIWLRLRGDKFELKVPLSENDKTQVDQYREFESPREIKRILGIEGSNDLLDDLTRLGYATFCQIETTRRTYSDGLLSIVLDVTDFGYNIGEVELLVNDSSESSDAVNRINKFFGNIDLPVVPVRGKVIEYIRRNNPDHYKILIASGTIRQDQL